MSYDKSLQEYYSLKQKIKNDKIFYKDKMLGVRRKLHLDFYNKNKKMFIFMDILFILALVFNFGAIALTELLVVKNTSNLVITEGNPIQAKINNYAYDPDTFNQFSGFIINMFFYSLLTVSYFLYRRFIFSEYGFMLLMIGVITICVGLFYDFISNVGVFSGVLLR